MPRAPTPVRPRVIDGNQYANALNESYFDPMASRLTRRLTGGTLSGPVRSTEAAIGTVRSTIDRLVLVDVRETARAAFDRIDGFHSRRFIQTFNANLRTDVSALLRQGGTLRRQVRALLGRTATRNVRVMRDHSMRLRDAIIKDLRGLPEFTQADMDRIVRTRLAQSRRELRRLARDQNQRLMGELTMLRQRQLGVNRYQWETRMDSRVRLSHRFNDQRIFNWSQPPFTGPPGAEFNCRCVAIPLLSQRQRRRLRARS